MPIFGTSRSEFQSHWGFSNLSTSSAFPQSSSRTTAGHRGSCITQSPVCPFHLQSDTSIFPLSPSWGMTYALLYMTTEMGSFLHRCTTLVWHTNVPWVFRVQTKSSNPSCQQWSHSTCDRWTQHRGMRTWQQAHDGYCRHAFLAFLEEHRQIPPCQYHGRSRRTSCRVSLLVYLKHTIL